MRSFSVMGVAVKAFFGSNARTLANPFPPAGNAATPKTWTTLTTNFESSQDEFYRVYFLNNHWLITTTQPGVRLTVISSLNGVLWGQHVVFTGTTGLQTPGAAFGAGLYVVTGSQFGVTPRIITSPDLGTWTSRVGGFLTLTTLLDPVFGNNTFLLVGNTNIITQYATSPDGITWTQQSNYLPNIWGQPIFDGTQFVAPVINASNIPKIATSPDGINWTEQSAALTISGPNFLANNGTTQYVVGDGLTIDGDSLTAAFATVTPVMFNDPTNNPTGWLAYGSGSDWARCNSINSAVQSSPNGLTWVRDIAPSAAATIDNMAWNGTEWIAVGSQTGAQNFAMTRGP